jgi:hypothetical protein
MANERVAHEQREAEVSTVEFVGSHSVRPDVYTIVVRLKAAPGAPETRLSLLLHPPEAKFLAQMLQRNPPQAETADHLAHDIERLQT